MKKHRKACQCSPCRRMRWHLGEPREDWSPESVALAWTVVITAALVVFGALYFYGQRVGNQEYNGERRAYWSKWDYEMAREWRHMPVSPECADVDRIRSLEAETGCALWGKENPCEKGMHLKDNGIGVSCITDKKR